MFQHEPDALPDLSIAHNLPSHAYHHERFIASVKEKRRHTGLPQLQKQAHCAVVPIFPSLPEQLHHCAPRLRAMREAAHLQSQIQY